jgi:hypothetical protein
LITAAFLTLPSAKNVSKSTIYGIPIATLQLILAKKSHNNGDNLLITHITYASFNIDGQLERTYGYIVNGLGFPNILGKAWAERNPVRYIADKRKLYIGRGAQHITVQEKEWLERNKQAWQRLNQVHTQSLVSGSVFAAIVRRATRRARKKGPDGTQIFAASIQDINRALPKLAERKQKKTEEEIQEEIPDEIGEQADAFLNNDNGAVAPHQGNYNHTIELVKDNKGKEVQVPWGPLYSMSREELLVLRKTLTDYLDKGWWLLYQEPAVL